MNLRASVSRCHGNFCPFSSACAWSLVNLYNVRCFSNGFSSKKRRSCKESEKYKNNKYFKPFNEH